MKKIIVCLLFLCILLAACSSAGDNSSVSTQGVNSNTAALIMNEPDESGILNFSEGNIEIVSARAGLYSSHYATNGTGNYEIFSQPSGDKNIIYHDFKTRTTVYLSSQVNAHFTDKTDQSHLDPCIASVKPIVAGNKLYIFRTNAPQWIERYGEEAQGYIYECDFDGSNRKTIYEFDEKEYLGGCAIAYDGQNFYYLATILDDEMIEVETNLFKLNISTGERTMLSSLNADSKHWIIDAGGGSIVLKNISNPMQYGSLEQFDEDAYANQRHAVSIVSTKSGELMEIASWKQDEKIVTSCNGNLLFIDSLDSTIRKQNLFTGETSTLASLPAKNADNYFDTYTVYPDIRGNHVFFSGIYHEVINNEEVGKSILFACDISTGEIQQITFAIDDAYVNIYGENEEYFFITIGRKEFPITDFFETGEAYVTNLLVEIPALVLKEDYFAGNIEYLTFEDLVYVN